MNDLRKAAEMALEALRNAEVVHTEQLNAMYALQEALAQSVDLAKVGEVGVWGHKREWVGLTVNEVLELLPSSKWKAEETLLFVQRIEDELKEKNT